MTDTVKLIIEISKVPKNDHERWVLSHGTPLDEVRAEIADAMILPMADVGLRVALDILDNIGKADMRGKADETNENS